MLLARHCSFLLFTLAVVPALPAQEPPTYSKIVGPFLVKYCVECHNDKKPTNGLSLQTYKALKEGGDHGPAIVPGKPDDSRLVKMLEGLQEPKMPPEKSELHPKKEEIAQVRAWVKAGAKLDKELENTILPVIPSKVKAASQVSALAYFPSGKYLAAGCYKELFLCDANTGTVVGKLTGWHQPVTAVAINKDGSRLAVALGKAGGPARIHVFPVDENNPLVWSRPLEFFVAHGDVIHQLAFSPDGKKLISVGYDRLVKIWDTTTGKNLKSLKEHSDSVYGVAYRPDGELFATAGADRSVKVWRADTGKLLYTLGEATDWVYVLAWSPDGKRLAAGGVDKSIRVWDVNETEGKVVQSVFAHQAAVWQLAYATDGKTLYSAGEDRIVKAWDTAKMTERKVYEAQPENILSLAVHPKGTQLALGRFDGALVLLDEASGKVQAQPLPTKDAVPPIKLATPEVEPNNSPGTGQPITLPAVITGTIDKAGDVDFFRFFAKAGQQLGVRVTVAMNKGKPSFEPFLQLTDGKGKVLVQSGKGHLGYTFAVAGWYALGIRDRDFGGGPAMKYELEAGDIPVVTSVFPLGLQQGTTADIHIDGVNLGGVTTVKVTADAKAPPGSKISIPLTPPTPRLGKVGTQGGWSPLGLKQLVVGEFPEVVEQPGQVLTLPVPGTANGIIAKPGDMGLWQFPAKKGQKLILEVNARRLGSQLDSYIEILDAKGQPVPLATLRALAKTYVAFRDHSSTGANIRIEAWSELAVNDYIYVGTELLKIRELPTHPDADCSFFSLKGKRLGFLGTTPTNLTKGEPMYKVSIHPPGTKFSPNGFPVVTLYYRNDDGGGEFGRDSRLFFDPPADGVYQVRIGDSSGQGSIDHGYRLTIRPPQPSFNVSFSPGSPAIWKGGALPISIAADRIDGYDGPIKVWFENLPPGFSAPTSAILAGAENTTLALWAAADALPPAKGPPLRLIAEATINGQVVRKEFTGGMLQAVATGDLVTTTEQSEVTIKPGGHAKLTLHIERHNGFTGRVPISVQGLPHGVKVLDIGLNGILITEKESQRTIEFYCEPWVDPLEHPIVISAQREGKGTNHAAKSVLLKVAK